MREFWVPPYVYTPGKGANICEGVSIVATVKGTSYPLGSACQADVDIARLFAAAPKLLAALDLAERLIQIACNVDAFKDSHRPGYIEQHRDTIRAAIAAAQPIRLP